jgi:hypothetical protein
LRKIFVFIALFLIVISIALANDETIETAMLSEEDMEIIQNLELLENLETLERFQDEDWELLENVEVIEQISEEENG